MNKRSLVKQFKENPILQTDIGEFVYLGSIGQGGNAYVLEFAKSDQHFAIKFIPHDDEQKVRRFIDEYFCAVTIPTHPNIARSYHFDSVDIDNSTYSIIIMKRYGKSLHEIGTIASESDDDKERKSEKLFVDLCKGLRHLHVHGIVHRDIKPQNILFDENTERFVISDLGIAHFNEQLFAKAAITKPTDRLANYLFSAPEQANSRAPAVPANDIYALAQVMQWYLKGKPIKGLGRERFHTDAAGEKLRVLDKIVERSLSDDPLRRFQSIVEISDFIKEAKKPKERDIWPTLEGFDDAIRKSFTKIRKIAETEDALQVEKFINNFLMACPAEDFWFVNADGGDNTFGGLVKLNNRYWLLNKTDEIKISKLIVYRDDGYIYKNFFILLVAPTEPFVLTDHRGKIAERNVDFSTWTQDFAILYKDRYIDQEETRNGYYHFGDETIEVSSDEFKDRCRYLKPYAFLIVPQGTASSRMVDRQPTEDLLNSVVAKSALDDETLKAYLDATRAHHSYEITKWN